MDLLECLERAPLEHLSRIATAAGLEPGPDRRALERELEGCLTDRAWLQGLLADLSDEEWAALKVVFFGGGDQGITVELTHQIVNLIAGKRRKSPARAVEDLVNRGLVFLRSQNYRQVFFIPANLLAVLTDIISRQMAHRICLGPAVPVRPLPTERDLIEDLHRFLGYVYRTEVTLTQQGQVYKRHLRALLDLLGDGNADEETLVGRYPEPLGLLMGYALDRHLLARENGHLLATAELPNWVGGPTAGKQVDLYGYWQDRYFYQDLQTFLQVMNSVGNQWVSVNLLVAELEPLINPSQRGSFLLRLKHHLSTFLAPIGLFELGEAGTGEDPVLACRLTRAGHTVVGSGQDTSAPELPAIPLLLQATFEVIAPRPVESHLLWNLELMADLVGRSDRTLTYRLSRQSVYRALKTGMTGDAMLAFLGEHSATGVPQNVAFDLRAWAATYGQVYLQEVMLLRCASPILAQQVKASRRTARFVLGELGPTDLIVDGEHYRDLLEGLEADGIMPRPTVERPGAGAKQQDD